MVKAVKKLSVMKLRKSLAKTVRAVYLLMTVVAVTQLVKMERTTQTQMNVFVTLAILLPEME